MHTQMFPQTFITFYVGLNVAEEVSNDFNHTIAPFLMGSVALGRSSLYVVFMSNSKQTNWLNTQCMFIMLTLFVRESCGIFYYNFGVNIIEAFF